MSRLDSAIRRLTSQKIALEWAARKATRMNGIILELGLGNGRTYDHLREILPNREIYVFEREIAAHPDCIPEENFQFLGDFRDSLPRAKKRLGANSVLAHLDIGTGEKRASQQPCGTDRAPCVGFNEARVNYSERPRINGLVIHAY